MHPRKEEQEINEDAPFHLVQTGYIVDEGIDNNMGGIFAQALENNEVRTQDFSQVDATDDFGHLYDDAPSMVQTSFVTESAQDAVDPNLPQKYAQLMNYNENRAMIPDGDAYNPNAPIHLLQTGFVTDGEFDKDS